MPLVSVDEAIKILNSSEVVVLPTETVYGLAGLISDESSLKKIFSLKKRPFYDPLIVHVKDTDQAQNYGDFLPIELLLAKNFWPGPLTIVVPKKNNISDLITHGGPTVAFRSPDHKAFQDILRALNAPLAAPSANLFGQTSPTETNHVFSELGRAVPVVDGGSCQRGIESTVIQVDHQDKIIKILRPGSLGAKDILRFLKTQNLSYKVEYVQQNNAPGFLKNHYQPKSPFLFIDKEIDNEDLQALLLEFNLITRQVATPWKLPESPALAARNLYSELRNFSETNQSFYLVAKSDWKNNELWTSIKDRLTKASHFQIIGFKGNYQLVNKA